jgi:hypothetical protein
VTISIAVYMQLSDLPYVPAYDLPANHPNLLNRTLGSKPTTTKALEMIKAQSCMPKTLTLYVVLVAAQTVANIIPKTKYPLMR